MLAQVPQLHPGWEFKVSAFGATWYARVGTNQVQRWRPEVYKESDSVQEEEEEDPEAAKQRGIAAAAAELLNEISSLKIQQADLAACITATQGKLEALTKSLKTKKGDALKAGQAQVQALEKEIKALSQNLNLIKSKLADAEKKLPSSSKESSKKMLQTDAVAAGKKGAQLKPAPRVKAISSLKSDSSSSTTAVTKNTKKIPVSLPSAITTVLPENSSGSSPAVRSSSKAAAVPVAEVKEFSRAVTRLDEKLMSISDEVCLDVDDQMWAPVKKLSFFPVFEKPLISLSPDTKKSAASSSLSAPSKPAATAVASPLNRSALPSPISSTRR
jgi:hypothetical protein